MVGDPINLAPLSEFYPNAIVQVFDSWGRLIYTSEKGYINNWDGYSNGQRLQVDTYYYVLKLSNEAEKRVGSVLILK
jgi:gliding motility-associated-like protein